MEERRGVGDLGGVLTVAGLQVDDLLLGISRTADCGGFAEWCEKRKNLQRASETRGSEENGLS